MSFLSIAFLLALPLAAAPLLLHLFDRRRQVVIEWGAMQFLMEAASRRTAARKIKQWLLLLLRMLAIAALVLALARPLLPGNWWGTTERSESIFILDNSMSMTRTSEGTALWERAISRVRRELSELGPGTSARVLLSSPYPVWATEEWRLDAGAEQKLSADLRKLRPTTGRSDLLSALFTAVQAEWEPTRTQRRIVLLTDGQRTDWSLEDTTGWRRFREVLENAALPTQLEIVNLESPADLRNTSIRGIRADRTVAGVNEPIQLAAEIKNYGQAATPTTSAVWTVGRQTLHESTVPSLDGGAQHELAWQHTFSEPGIYRVACRISANDQLAPDDEAAVIVEVVNQVPILLVDANADLADIQQDTFFIQAALGWIDGEPLDQKAVYAPTLVAPERLVRTELNPYRAVVIPSYTELSAAAVERLVQFVRDGGGLWVALGPRTNVENFRQYAFAEGNGFAPLSIDDRIESQSPEVGETNAALPTIDPFVDEHPANAQLANHEQLDLGDITIAERYQFVSPGQGENLSVLLKTSSGDALAVENYLGSGRVIVQGIPLRLQWSELVRSQAFVVMVRDWLDYLTQPRATRHNLRPGEPIALHVTDTAVQQATLRTPHGDEIELTGESAGEGLTFRSRRTLLPGDYWLDAALSGDSIPFHVERDADESLLTPLSSSDRQQLAEVAGLRRGEFATSNSRNEADPLWPLLLMIVIGLIAAELLLSGLIARERFGAEPIAESTDRWPSDEGPGSPAEPVLHTAVDSVNSPRDRASLTA